MVASITTTSAVSMPDVASVTTAPEGNATAQATAPAAQPVKTVASSAQPPAKDTVELSSTSLALSKALNEQKQDERTVSAKQETSAVATKPADIPAESAKADTATVKRYPPFMGNTSELKALKQYSPALYREILRMIIPPPMDLSYSDQQMLNGFGTEKATAFSRTQK